MPRIVILGAGVMGSAMAVPAVQAGCAVTLVGTHLDDDIVAEIAAGRAHPRLGLTPPFAVEALPSTDLRLAMATTPDLVILGVSSAGVDWAIERLVETMNEPIPVLIITKGVATGENTLEVLPRLIAREVRRRGGPDLPVAAVGGPCIAGELAAGRDTSVVIAAEDETLLPPILALLKAPFYHARPSTDIVGVELSAAFKNFYTLAVGAPAGLLEREGRAANGALMYNLSSALFSQAVAEMALLVECSGGHAETVHGLAGVGDLYVTCQAGRNGRMGRLLGLGIPYSVAKATHMASETVEGAQLALDAGPALEAMLASGALPADRMPLMRAIIAAICRDEPLALDFSTYRAS